MIKKLDAARIKDVIMEETSRDNQVDILELYIASLGEESEVSVAAQTSEPEEVAYG